MKKKEKTVAVSSGDEIRVNARIDPRGCTFNLWYHTKDTLRTLGLKMSDLDLKMLNKNEYVGNSRNAATHISQTALLVLPINDKPHFEQRSLLIELLRVTYEDIYITNDFERAQFEKTKQYLSRLFKKK